MKGGCFRQFLLLFQKKRISYFLSRFCVRRGLYWMKHFADFGVWFCLRRPYLLVTAVSVP